MRSEIDPSQDTATQFTNDIVDTIIKSINCQFASLKSHTRLQRRQGILVPFKKEVRKFYEKVPTHETYVSTIVELTVSKWGWVFFQEIFDSVRLER